MQKTGTLKKAYQTQRSRCGTFKYVYRHHRKRKIRIRQITKQKLVRATKKNRYYIPYSKYFKIKKGKLFGKETPRGTIYSRLGSRLFELSMLKVMEDMVTNKNVYNLPWVGIDMLVVEFHSKSKGVMPIFTLDTKKCKLKRVYMAEKEGYAWKVVVNGGIQDLMQDEIHINKKKYTVCNTLLGNQLSVSSRGKFLSSLMLKPKKKELET